MRYFYVEPEVAGGLGENTILDSDAHPPIIMHLHYQFDGWLGDALLETFPAFIVTLSAKIALIDSRASGILFDEVEVTTSDLFLEVHPNLTLPSFFWLQVFGQAGQDDFGIHSDGRLIISEKAIETIGRSNLTNATIESV